MRARVVIAAVGAVALAAAVLTLRGQVEPAAAPSGPATPSLTTTPAAGPLDPLPLRGLRRQLDWQAYPTGPGGDRAVADREHLTVLRFDQSGPRQLATVVVIHRASGRQVLAYRPEPTEWQPTYWLLQGGALLVLEDRLPAAHPVMDGQTGNRLMRVELSSGARRDLPLRSVQRLRPDGLVAARDEVLVAGGPAAATQACVVAVRPSTGADRIVQCERGRGQAVWFARGSSSARWRFGAIVARPCAQWYELAPNRSARPVPFEGAQCGELFSTPIGEWTVYLEDRGVRSAMPRLRASGSGIVLTLDDGALPGVMCGEHYYWISGRSQAPRLLRWHPGHDHTHIALTLDPDGGNNINRLACSGGVLTVVMRAVEPRSPADAQVLVLDDP